MKELAYSYRGSYRRYTERICDYFYSQHSNLGYDGGNVPPKTFCQSIFLICCLIGILGGTSPVRLSFIFLSCQAYHPNLADHDPLSSIWPAVSRSIWIFPKGEIADQCTVDFSCERSLYHPWTVKNWGSICQSQATWFCCFLPEAFWCFTDSAQSYIVVLLSLRVPFHLLPGCWFGLAFPRESRRAHCICLSAWRSYNFYPKPMD